MTKYKSNSEFFMRILRNLIVIFCGMNVVWGYSNQDIPEISEPPHYATTSKPWTLQDLEKALTDQQLYHIGRLPQYPKYIQNAYKIHGIVKAERYSKDFNVQKSEAIEDMQRRMLYQDLVRDKFYKQKYKNDKEFDSYDIARESYYLDYVSFTPRKKLYDKGPAIIHVHGGPYITITEETPHAEIAYWLSHGFTIVPLKYHTKWEGKKVQISEFEKRDIDDIAFFDLLITFSLLNERPDIDINKVILRGGSYGSHLNFNFVTRLNDDLSNLFHAFPAGVHLSGGDYNGNFALNDYFYEELWEDKRFEELDNKNSKTLADHKEMHRLRLHEDLKDLHRISPELPIFMSHGRLDQTSPIEDALVLAELLLKNKKDVRFHFITQGGHHILPDLPMKGPDPEFSSYVARATRFIHDIVRGNAIVQTYQPADRTLQLAYFNEFKKLTEMRERVSKEAVASLGFPEKIISTDSAIQIAGSKAKENMTQTEAYYKLLLGEKFTGNPDNDLNSFLDAVYLKDDVYTHLKSSPDEIVRIKEKREKIINDKIIREKLTEIYKNELKHPQSHVFYHATDRNGYFLYHYYSILHSVLKGDKEAKLRFLRPLLHIFEHHQNVKGFLATMQKGWDKSKQEIFNNMGGYAERAISVNLFLGGHHIHQGGDTLDYFFNSKTAKSISLSGLLKEFYFQLGLGKEDLRADRYKRLLDSINEELSRGRSSHPDWEISNDRDREKKDYNKCGGLLQIFADDDVTDEVAYLSEMWGLPVQFMGENGMTHNPSAFLNHFMRNPINAEKTLAAHSTFENPYGIKNMEPPYTPYLQGRMYLHPKFMASEKIEIKGYSPINKFLEQNHSLLETYIIEDLQDLLSSHIEWPFEALPYESLWKHREKLNNKHKPKYKKIELMPNYFKQLGFAVLHGDTNFLRKWLEEGNLKDEVYSPRTKRFTDPLAMLIHYDKEHYVAEYLEKRHMIYAQDSKEWPRVSNAIHKNGEAKWIDLMLKYDALDKEIFNNVDMLTKAIQDQKPDLIKYLLKHVKNITYFFDRSIEKNLISPLCQSVEKNDVLTFKALLHKGADWEVKNIPKKSKLLYSKDKDKVYISVLEYIQQEDKQDFLKAFEEYTVQLQDQMTGEGLQLLFSQ